MGHIVGVFGNEWFDHLPCLSFCPSPPPPWTTELKKKKKKGGGGGSDLESVWKVTDGKCVFCFTMGFKLFFSLSLVPVLFLQCLPQRLRIWPVGPDKAPHPLGTLQQALEIKLRLSKQLLYTRGPA